MTQELIANLLRVHRKGITSLHSFVCVFAHRPYLIRVL